MSTPLPLTRDTTSILSVEAPLKENLAAGILKLTGWKPGEEALCDPMCGSGTFLIEAAQMALDVAPGLGRHFAFERFKHYERDTWLPIRQAAEARFKLYGQLAIILALGFLVILLGRIAIQGSTALLTNTITVPVSLAASQAGSHSSPW